MIDETEALNLRNLVELTDDERDEIKLASKYYNGKVFEYPAAVEALLAYPGDPNAARLLSAAERLVAGLYDPCKAATRTAPAARLAWRCYRVGWPVVAGSSHLRQRLDAVQ